MSIETLRDELSTFHPTGFFTLELLEVSPLAAEEPAGECDRLLTVLGFDGIDKRWAAYSVEQGELLVTEILLRSEIAFGPDPEHNPVVARALAARLRAFAGDANACYSNGRWLDGGRFKQDGVIHRRAAHRREIGSMRDLGVIFLGTARALVLWYEE